MTPGGSLSLLLSVHFHDGRYHGVRDWPPAPARLFQALVAAAAEGHAIPAESRKALEWLERQGPPTIAAPTSHMGRGFANFVPNNDLDAVGGDLGRVASIRTAKTVRPRFFEASVPFLYRWDLADGEGEAQTVCRLAERLYQLGRGIDMAWAVGEVLTQEDAEVRLSRHGGPLHCPVGGGGELLACPVGGSLASLTERFERMRRRFVVERQGRTLRQLFTQPPKPRFAMQSYDAPPDRLLYDLRVMSAEAGFAAQPLAKAAALVERLRDAAAARLSEALPEQARTVARVFVGRNAGEADKASRLRILPLPSIGHPQAERSIRRLLVERPPDCPLRCDDIEWAFSGLELHDPETGELAGWTLVPSDDWRMLDRYGVSSKQSRGGGQRLWRTVTPAVLPQRAARRRIDPERRTAEAKRAAERSGEERRAATAVLQALRHLQLRTPVEGIRVQREPFDAKGLRAEASAPGTRFAKECFWHLEIAFAEPVEGPLILGDGRYLGLGLMAPQPGATRDLLIFDLPANSTIPLAEAPRLLQALRRALMSLAGKERDGLKRLFSGHEPGGGPAGDGRHRHVFLAAEGASHRIERLLVVAPWAADRSVLRNGADGALFERTVGALRALRAGPLGVLALEPARSPVSGDPLIAPARVWRNRTPYRSTRHARRLEDPVATIAADVIAECRRRGLPRPQVEVLSHATGPRGGNPSAQLCLRFAVAVAGPLLLGRDSHRGGGLFVGCDDRS